MASATCIEINGLSVHYGDLQALWDVSIAIGKGGIVSIIGANGAGKSTLLKTIVGALPPSRGTILHDNRDISGLSPFQTLARGIALVPEGRRIFPRLTVRENLLIGAYLPRVRKIAKYTIDKVFTLFPVLKERAEQLGTSLSGGEQQMLAIGRALMSEPDVILFDEISLGLAPLMIKNIYAALKEINSAGVSMVLVEQDVKRSLKTADYAYIMQKGRVVLHGKPCDLADDAVKRAYFGV